MQNRKKLIAGAGALLFAFIGLAALPDRGAADDAIFVPGDIREAVNKMADDIAMGKDVNKAAAAFFNAHPGDLPVAMWIFKPRRTNGKGGLGIGPKPGVYARDGIEMLIINKGNPKPRNADQRVTKEDLESHSADYVRVANVIIAMADITYQYKPTVKLPDKNPADWIKYADEMKKAAVAMKAGVKARNPNATKKAFIQLYSSCTNCHSTFRDADESIPVRSPILRALCSMADAVNKGQKIDKDADRFFRTYKHDLKDAKVVFQERAIGGLGVGSHRGAYTPDDIEGYVATQANKGHEAMTEAQLKAAANDLNRLADVTIAMAVVMQRYKPKHLIIGGPTGVAKPAEWMAYATAMKQGAVDLKVAVKANKPGDARLAFRKIYSSCATCHHAFRD